VKSTKWWTIIALFGATLPAGQAAELWVAPNGGDHNAGTKEQPFATLDAAQRKARELRRIKDPSIAGGITIVVRGGVYPLAAPLLFRWEDAGTADSPTIVQAAAGERPIISGGVQISGWTKFAEPVERLPAAARGQVWVANVPRVGGRALEFRQLWVSGKKATRARTPNGSEMFRLAGWDRMREQAIVPAASVVTLRSPLGAEMVIEQQWEIAILRLTGITPDGMTARLNFAQPESRIEFEHPWPQPILPPKGGGAFYLVNALEFLDAPGEWFEDAPAGRVYYWPREGEDLAREVVVAPALESLVRVEGTLDRPTAYLDFRGLTFAHAAWTRPGEAGHVPHQAGMPMVDAYKIAPPGTPDKKALENQAWIERIAAGVTVANAHHIRFERCTFEHLAASGLDLARGTQDDVVEGCVFRDIGDNGIQAGSYQEGGVEIHVPYVPSDPREVCANLRLANNLVTDTANEDWGGVGITVGYARGVTIEHNEISHTSYTGISVGWGWTRTASVLRDNRIHANLIHHVATRMCDTAGIYTQSAQPGTIVSENVVRDITMSPYVDRPDHWFYLYTDEGSSNITVRDNWCPAEKFLKNANGPGNVWENNGPMVSDAIKAAAGLEPAFQDLK
jgi:hypothetical protein